MTILAMSIRIASHVILNTIVDITIVDMDITIMAMDIIMVMDDRGIDLNHFRRCTATLSDARESIIPLHSRNQQLRTSVAKGFFRRPSHLKR